MRQRSATSCVFRLNFKKEYDKVICDINKIVNCRPLFMQSSLKKTRENDKVNSVPRQKR